MCGAPLKVPMKGVRLDLFKSFMPNIVCVPEILQQNGYNNYFLLGSAASFSGVDNFLNQNGFNQYWGKEELQEEMGNTFIDELERFSKYYQTFFSKEFQ